MSGLCVVGAQVKVQQYIQHVSSGSRSLEVGRTVTAAVLRV